MIDVGNSQSVVMALGQPPLGVVHFQPQAPDTGLPALPQIIESVEIDEKDTGPE